MALQDKHYTHNKYGLFKNMLNLYRKKQVQNIADPIIRQKYLKYFQLPKNLRQIIFAVETADKMGGIAKKNTLNNDQTQQISYITGMVLLGETNITDFLKSIEKGCKLEREQARQLARDINSLIFLPIKDDLKKIHKISKWPRENENVNKNSNVPQLNGNVVDLKEK